jgi:hypothetical protein
MKSIYAIFVMALLILAASAAAREMGQGNRERPAAHEGSMDLAGTDDSGPENDSSDVNAATIDMIDKEAKDSRTIEECVRKILVRYPRFDRVQATVRCRELMALAGNMTRPELPDGNMTRPQRPDGNLTRPVIPGRVLAAKTLFGAQFGEKFADWRFNRIDGFLNKTGANLSRLSEEQMQVFLHMPRAEQKRILNGSLWEELDNFTLKKVKAADMYKKREIKADVLKGWQNLFQKAQERFQNATENEKIHRAGWMDAKSAWKQKCNDTNSTECQELEQQAIENAKIYLNTSATAMISHLEQIKATVQESDIISDDEVTEIVESIDAQIESLNSVIDDIEAADTKEEVKAAAKELDGIWRATRWNAVAYVAHVMNTRVDTIIKKSEKLEERMDCVIAQMDNQSIDTSAIEDKLNNFSEKVQDAKDDWKKAKDLYTEIRALAITNKNGSNNDNIKEKAEEMKTLVDSAHGKLKEANKLIVEIAREAKESGANISSCNARDKDLAPDEEYVVEENE